MLTRANWPGITRCRPTILMTTTGCRHRSSSPRKLVAQASRNGFFFLLDRTNGKHILTVPYGNATWAKGLDAQGRPIPDTNREPKTDGALASPSAGGATNWYAPSYSPQTGLF